MTQCSSTALKQFLCAACLCAAAALMPAEASTNVVFGFNDGSAFDGAGIGAVMTTGGVSITTVDIVGQDGSKNTGGAGHKTNIYGSWDALGINDENASGNEYGSFDSGEAWVFCFDADVYLVEIDLAGQGEGAELTISSAEFSDMVLPYVDSEAVHDLSNAFVSAGAEITFQMTSPTNAADTSLRIKTLTVEPALSVPTETAGGTPYAWLDTYYTGLVSAADYLAAESADSDGDGMTAREEYLAGTVPTNAASRLQVNAAGPLGTNHVVSWQSVTGKYYSVLVESNLAAASNGWSTTANNIRGLENQTSFTTTVSGADSAFFKVGIEKREIYLLIGQSNMAGRAPIEEEDEGGIEGCELFNSSGEWEAAANPLNQYSTIRKDLDLQQLNPGCGFALRMREEHPDITLGLVVNARGGTSITDWEKGDDYYEAAVARVEDALAGGGCRLAGILWHQGEANSSLTNSYMGYLTTMIEDLRADFGDPDLPFVAGQLEQDDVTETVKERPINDYIILLPTLLDRTAVATTEGLTTLDGTHFDTESQRELGRRYAEALLSLEE